MEAVIAIVGFLGAGKTTLLQRLMVDYIDAGWDPYVVLNDYEDAELDVGRLAERVGASAVKALSGSCICCSGISELRETINRIPERPGGVTLIEANGTTDAVSLMGFLGVGLVGRYLPPVQVSVVDVKNWQQRGEHNELESNQVQVSSLIVLTHLDRVSVTRRHAVAAELQALNPGATILTSEEIDISLLPELSPSQNSAQGMDHHRAHWASCSVDLPQLPDLYCVSDICDAIPMSILRVKGCTLIGDDEGYTYFERGPDGEVTVRPYHGTPVTGAKLLAVGPGSEPRRLTTVIAGSLDAAKARGVLHAVASAD